MDTLFTIGVFLVVTGFISLMASMVLGVVLDVLVDKWVGYALGYGIVGMIVGFVALTPPLIAVDVERSNKLMAECLADGKKEYECAAIVRQAVHGNDPQTVIVHRY